MQVRQECGPRRVPKAVVDLMDDLAVDIDREMKRRGWGLKELQKNLGISRRRSHDLSAYLRGAVTQSTFGFMPIMRLAEDLNIPIKHLTGDDARQAA